MINKLENILKELSTNYDSIITDQLSYINGDNQVSVDIKRDCDKITISLTKEKVPSLQSFLEKIDENTWSYLLDNFQEVTGQSLKAINNLYEQKDYNAVKELIKLVLNDYIDKLEKLLDD